MLLTNHFAPTPQKLPAGSRFDSVPVISVNALAGVPAFVRHAFGDKLLRQANRAAMLDIEAIEDRDCFIPHVTMSVFVNAVAKMTGEEYFGLLLAPHLTIASYGCWGEYVLGAPTLGEAIGRATATIGFHSRGDALSLGVADGQARLSYSSAARGLDGYAQVACGAAGVVVSLYRAFLPIRPCDLSNSTFQGRACQGLSKMCSAALFFSTGQRWRSVSTPRGSTPVVRRAASPP